MRHVFSVFRVTQTLQSNFSKEKSENCIVVCRLLHRHFNVTKTIYMTKTN